MIGWLIRLFGKKERWSINCGYHNWTAHDLNKNEAGVLLETLRDSEKASVLVWRTGWTHWRNIRDPEAAPLLHAREIQVSAPVLPELEDFDPEITAVRPLIEKPANFLSRKHIRFDASYPVTVVSGTQDFSTETLDLSEGGLCLKDAVPDWVAGYCSVIITVEDGRTIEVMCSVAEDQAHAKTRLEMAPSEKQSEYLSWFESHPKYRT